MNIKKNCDRENFSKSIRRRLRRRRGADDTDICFLKNSLGRSFGDNHTIIYEEQDMRIIYRAF